jgi:hypothetical protein
MRSMQYNVEFWVPTQHLLKDQGKTTKNLDQGNLVASAVVYLVPLHPKKKTIYLGISRVGN